MWVVPRAPTSNRHKRDVDVLNGLAIGGGQKWGTDEWTPERIIQHYDPASWNPHEPISGARGPIFNLNRIIRLQAVVQIMANFTAKSLRLVAQHLDELRTATLQLKLGLDYVLARQGGLCATLKLTKEACCFNISDHGEAIHP